MSKQITVQLCTGGYHDLQLLPGTTPVDVLNQLNLGDEWIITAGEGQPAFADGENLYESLADGQKVYAATRAEVGSAN